MSEWKEFFIEDLTDFCNSKRIPLSSMQRAGKKGHYPYYGASGIVDYVDEYIFDGSYILISEDGENLKTRKTPIAFEASGQFWVNNHAHILKAKKPFLTKLIILYFSQLDLSPYLTGAVQPKLNKASLATIPLFLPSCEKEQQAIASVLSALDDKIDLLQRQNQTLEQMAATLFRQWFIEEAKEDWEDGCLGDIATNIRVNADAQAIQDDEIYIGLEHIERRNIALSNHGYGSEVASNKSRFMKTDVLFGKLRPYFHKVCMAPFDGVCSTDILVLRAKQPAFKSFILFAFFQDDVVAFANLTSGGTRMPRADWKTLSEYPIAIPPIEKVLEFEALANPSISKIFDNLKQIQTLQTLRDTLLPKLISGEVRLKGFETLPSA